MNRLLVLVLLLASLPAALAAQERENAYEDAMARELVARARARRGADRGITEYRTRSTERISVTHRLLRRERLLFRRETAAAIHWRRGGDTEVEVLGAREVVPIADARVQVPAELGDYMPHLVFDPLDSEFLMRMDSTFIRHPLAEASERHYRFASGDSTVIRLPGGREVRLRELRFTPVRRDPHLIAGSFWLDADTYAVVQAVFRIARPYRIGDDADDGDDDDDPPFFLRDIRADITHIAVDYALWELRWWLPRYMTMAGVVELGSFGTVPLEYQRSYADYDIVADTSGTLPPLPPDSVRARCRRDRFALTVRVGDPDSVRTRRAREEAERRAAAEPDSAYVDCPGRYIVSIPDTVNLLESAALPGSIYGDEPLLTGLELEQLEERLRDLPLPSAGSMVLRTDWRPWGPGTFRYNRIEGLAPGARLGFQAGLTRGGLAAWYGTADEQVSVSADASVLWRERTLRLDAYRGLRGTDPSARPFSFFNSLGALLFGQDDTQFYRALGGSLTITPAPERTQWYGLRLYGERQSPVRPNTDWSITHWIDPEHEFRGNITAERANQMGTDVVLRAQQGVNPRRVRAGVQLDVRAEAGTFAFVRPALTVRGTVPVLAGMTLGLEAAAGAAAGAVPVQSHWFLGGTHSLRGYPGATLNGESFWRGRLELGTAVPMARLALFSDLGWAGPANGDAWRAGRPLQSVGAGASFLDGILRFDVARAVRAPTGWRVHLYLDGLL